MRGDAQEEASQARSDFIVHRASVERKLQADYSLAQDVAFDAVDRILTQADAAYRNNTYYGYLDATELYDDGEAELATLTDAAQSEHEKRTREIAEQQKYQAGLEAAAEQARFQKAKQAARTAFWITVATPLCFVLLPPVGLIMGIGAYSQYKTISNKEGLGFAIAAIVIGSIGTAFIVLYLLAGIMASANR